MSRRDIRAYPILDKLALHPAAASHLSASSSGIDEIAAD
jgi:hypothetical protein